MEKSAAWGRIGLGSILALGLVIAAVIVAGQFKNLGSGRQSILVKGLAEKMVQADVAEWSLGVQVHGETFAETLAAVRHELPEVTRFLAGQGFGEGDTLQEGEIEIVPNRVEVRLPSGEWHSEQRGFVGTQYIHLRTRQLDKVMQAKRAVIELPAEGRPVIDNGPDYLVSDLESVKMSLIGDATRNARQRAQEFAKVGEVKVGAMRSASQGAFYILPENSSSAVSDYGGVYDKSTINKLARVVVTIDYAIE